jgi:multiple sugar transport system ATP-binding protein
VSGLAGGDRQRVALGRAIVRRPKAFLMDEPLGTLDSEFRHLMCLELRALHNRIGATTVYVTHDQLEAMSMADTIAIMNHGVVEQIGPPQEVYDRPATMFVADFVGSPPMNFLPAAGGAAAGGDAVIVDGVKVPVPAFRESSAAGELVLGVRPEDVRLDDRSKIRAEVFGTEYLGTTQIVTLTTKAGPIKARIGADRLVQRGETVGLAFDPAKLSVFEKATGRAIRSALHDGPGVASGPRRRALAGGAHG